MTESASHSIPIAAVAAIYIARMAEVFTKRNVIPGRKAETLTFSLFMACGLFIVIGGITEFLRRRSSLWWPTFVIGTALSAASFAIRRAAIRALGRFWSLHSEIRDGHNLVDSGPFAYVRHPVYSSMILELLGIGLILNSWISLAVVFAVFAPTLIVRVRIEERSLVEQLGEAYRAYARNTPAIVPGFFPRRRK